MRNRCIRALVAAAAIALGLSATAGEPDGRVALRYLWLDDKDAPAGTAHLRVTVTAVVPLEDTRFESVLPGGVELAMRGNAAQAGEWPQAGLPLGALTAGQTMVFDLDVGKPERGGGLISFTLVGTWKGEPVREGMSVFVGEPDVKPVERDGVLEYPAGREDRDR